MNSMPLSLHRSTNFLAAPNPSGFSMSNTPTTIGSEGAGESLSHPSDVSFLRPAQPGSTTNFRADRFYDDDEDEVKNFREVDQYVSPSPYSELSASTAATSHHV
uniref:Uncharacterized protein n=2 Tax=Caenorhabditis japonica TaxID=281687 RepID=A0A8R1ETR0_CAEJA